MGKNKRVTSWMAGILSLGMLVQPLGVLAADTSIRTGVKDKEAGQENGEILYLVNCAASDNTVVPNNYSMGTAQSNVHQEYGPDSETGFYWGYEPDSEHSKIRFTEHADSGDIASGCAYLAEDIAFQSGVSGLKYNFTIPEGKDPNCVVTVGFKVPSGWGNKILDVNLEEKTAEQDIELWENTLLEREYEVKVEDGELNVMVHNPDRQNAGEDPIVSYIQVKTAPTYDISFLRNTIAQYDAMMGDTPYGDASLELYEAAKAEALIDNGSQNQEAIKEAYQKLRNAYLGLKEKIVYDSITGTAGAPMYDTNGNQIQAHGGQIQKLTVNGQEKWYWIGEDKTYDYRPVGGIHLYSSDDLYNWKDEGVVLRTMESETEFTEDAYFRELYGDYDAEKKAEVFIDLDKNNCVMERPKMIYNEKTGKYVIWFHADGRYPGSDADYGKAKAGVAIADSPAGPYKLLGSYKLNYNDDPNADHGYDGWEGRGSVRDMNLFVDDDKTAYIIYSSEGNRTTFISKLNEEYTDLAVPRAQAREGIDFTRNFIGWSREAPAMFQYHDKYYMVNSGCTGWSPNPAQYAVADTPLGPWNAMGDPCSGQDSGTTYGTQSTCVVPVDAEDGKFMYMGDRWNAGDLSESRYVWLPMEFGQDDTLKINRNDNWKLEELEGKGKFEVTSDLILMGAPSENPASQLPAGVDVSWGKTQVENSPVTWEFPEGIPSIGQMKAQGTLTDYDRTFTKLVNIYNEDMVYFAACGKEDSEYFTKGKELITKLGNESSVSEYTPQNGCGYLVDKENIGLHEGNGIFENGWYTNKEGVNIDFAFDLEPGNYRLAAGYQEWWNTQREIKITVTGKNAQTKNQELLASKEFTLWGTDKSRVEELEFTVLEGEKQTINVSVSKAGGSSDPVLSFLAILKAE